jgi:tRNA/rRNA methyltransferase
MSRATGSGWPEKNLIVALVRPEEAGNVGAVARAMKNMGISRLHLVSPCRFDTEAGLKMAHRSRDLLKRANIFESVDEAIAPAAEVIGFTVRRRRKGPIPTAFDRMAGEVLSRASEQPVALLFGPEGTGLTNDDLSKCQRVASITAGSRFPSLNLAQAVLAAAYTLRLAWKERRGRVGGTDRSLSSARELDALYRHLEETLVRIGFLREPSGKSLMRDLRRVFARSRLDSREVRILRGILRQIEWAMDVRRKT